MKISFVFEDDYYTVYVDWFRVCDVTWYPAEFKTLEEAKQFVADTLHIDVSVFND